MKIIWHETQFKLRFIFNISSLYYGLKKKKKILSFFQHETVLILYYTKGTKWICFPKKEKEKSIMISFMYKCCFQKNKKQKKSMNVKIVFLKMYETKNLMRNRLFYMYIYLTKIPYILCNTLCINGYYLLLNLTLAK